MTGNILSDVLLVIVGCALVSPIVVHLPWSIGRRQRGRRGTGERISLGKCRRQVDEQLLGLWSEVFEDLAPTRTFVMYEPHDFPLSSPLPTPRKMADETYQALLTARNPYAFDYRMGTQAILDAAYRPRVLASQSMTQPSHPVIQPWGPEPANPG